MELGMAPSWNVKSPNSLLGPTIGFYWEPNYDYGFDKQHEQSIGWSAGIIIAIH